MNWLKVPPLNSLRAFSALAETGRYSLAADRLNVTRAAVSQQVKLLERHLGVPLVTRIGRSIELTSHGALLARELDVGFAIIARGIERISEDAANRPVQVTMSPAFAVEWLLPKIAEFQQENPDITLMLNPTSEVIDLKRGSIDVAIRYRDRRRIERDFEPLLITDMIVIGAPSLLKGREVRDSASLAQLPWLQELGTNEAAEWFTFHGVVPDRPLTVNHMPGNLIMNAVRRGDGVTYTARAFFREDLAAGTVVELFSEPRFGFYLIETPDEERRPAVKTFLRWLKSKAETVTV